MTSSTDDMIRSELRRPVNAYQQLENSIHNDSVAQPLGLRGGTVAGSVHMDQFPPALLDVFGNDWFESGSLSLTFKNPTVDGEQVAVLVRRPATTRDCQTEVAVERDDGLLVAQGTAGVGQHDEATHLHGIELRRAPDDALRMFPSLTPGQTLLEHGEVVSSDEARTREASGLITEPLGWYTGDSPWGGPIASPSAVVRMLYRPTSQHVSRLTGGAVGLFGAIEIRHLDGPVKADVHHQVTSTLVARGESPKTEYLWFDSVGAVDGRDVVSMRMQLRYMKASSSHYAP